MVVWTMKRAGAKTFGAIMLIIFVALFLILIYFVVRGQGTLDLMGDGFKMFATGNTSINP